MLICFLRAQEKRVLRTENQARKKKIFRKRRSVPASSLGYVQKGKRGSASIQKRRKMERGALSRPPDCPVEGGKREKGRALRNKTSPGSRGEKKKGKLRMGDRPRRKGGVTPKGVEVFPSLRTPSSEKGVGPFPKKKRKKMDLKKKREASPVHTLQGERKKGGGNS